tara:strand:+ start:829 stop:1041 length:213 start_codon:yes stop_codon:yes gene_type:complete
MHSSINIHLASRHWAAIKPQSQKAKAWAIRWFGVEKDAYHIQVNQVDALTRRLDAEGIPFWMGQPIENAA